MIYTYGFTKIGHYHVDKSIVCQDFHLIKEVDKHFCVAAVADGLGSESHSDIASKIACETVVDFLFKNINRKTDKKHFLEIIKNGFCKSLTAINEYSKENDIEIDQMDTTLVAAVFMDGEVYFGNSGDSGLMILNKEGLYKRLSEKQIDDNGLVFPLCFGEEKWQFGSEKDVSSVLLATDGIFNSFFPYLLNDQENPIYVPLCEYLMNNDSLRMNKKSLSSVREKIRSFIDSISKDEINDDITLVLMLDDSFKAKRQNEDYYKMPNWNELKKARDEKYFREAYPNLKQNKNDTDSESSKQAEETNCDQ